jgi:hypothetical protein
MSARLRPHVALSRNPIAEKASLTVQWPGDGDAVIELFDMQGRRVRTEFSGNARGTTERTFRTAGLAPGIYLVNARQGGMRTTRRITVLQ